MAVNRDKVDLWKADVAKSVDFYNSWFMNFAPKAFRDTRIATTKQVEQALKWTENLTNIRPETLQNYPSVLSMLRMTTCPPIARDRLVGLAGVFPNLVKSMEVDKRVPPMMKQAELTRQLEMIGEIFEKMADPDIFVWKGREDKGKEEEIHRASTIVADRLCGAVADPIIRNAQEQRQLAAIRTWLEVRGYRELQPGEATNFLSMPNGTFSFRFNVRIRLDSGKQINIPIDAVIMRKNAKSGEFPALFEAKSMGDRLSSTLSCQEEFARMPK